MHPGARILLYVLSALALPGLSLYGLLLALAGGLVLARRRLPEAWLLLRRSRWLFLLLGLGYAYTLPGPVALPWLGAFSPSVPGAVAGAMQMLRLAMMLLLLDGLVLAMGERALLGGLHGLFRGLARLGLSAERATVRLALTLRAMAAQHPRPGLAELLRGHVPPDADQKSIEIELSPWSALDIVLLWTAMIMVMGLWLNA